MAEHSPIPDAALDDRLGFVGTAGSGKTYNAGGCIERLIASGARCIIVDPLDVWWGLRLCPDGKRASSYNVVIVGGSRGDLPLNEHAGALIGETVAGTAESFVVSLSTLATKASERRFMLAFLTALHRRASGEPVHLIFDEADLWAPQQLRDKEGEAAKLLGQMETIVRRGRIKGFIPWLISQRPAVINKDVLSQIDGLVAFKLTSSQDRNAIGDWVQGQADRAEWDRIWAALPTMQRGNGVVWVPGRGILETVAFPRKETFDSSATPKRGEVRSAAELKPLNVEALKARLETVAKEAVENDPKRLKLRIAELERELAKALKAGANREQLDQAEARGNEIGYRAGLQEGQKSAIEIADKLRDRQAAIDAALGYLTPLAKTEDGIRVIEARPARKPPTIDAVPQRRRITAARPAPNGSLDPITAPQQKILDAIAWWRAVGVSPATRVQVAMVAAYSPNSGGFNNLLGGLRTAGLIDYPGTGTVDLTGAGSALASAPSAPPSTEELHQRVYEVLSAPQRRILEALIGAYPQALDRDTLGQRTDYSPTSGGFNNLLGSLRSLRLIDYPQRGYVAAEPVLFVGNA